jgi:hypothetical protein
MRSAAILSGLLALAMPATGLAKKPRPAAVPAGAATPTISITPGEWVTVRVADNGSGFIELGRTRGDPGPRAAGTIRFSFANLGGMRMLKTENGYTQAFNYRARMFLGRRSANTSVCSVMAGIIGFESWGDPITRLEFREPSLSDGGGMACQ